MQTKPKKISSKEGVLLSTGKDIMSIKLNTTHTNGQFSLVERLVAAQFQSPPQFHAHEDTDWLCYVLSGTLHFYNADIEYVCKQGDCIYLPRLTYFRWANPYDVDARCLIFYTPGGFEGFFEEVVPLIGKKTDHIGEYDKTLNEILAVQDRYKIIRKPLGEH
ncbi:cupin domain-containing protein [bacterium]|nr:MAG: cupin domain-containing protein [bacterium]